ncbi:MAG TPA: DUF3822 family protein [Flavobacterium sp.]|nr:DUF3822 family protein [Flavobacterium sp.]
MTNNSSQKLFIEVSMQNFSYCIKNQKSKQIIDFKTIPLDSFKAMDQQLDFIFDKETTLHSNFDDILVLHSNNLNTFIPEALFDETALGSYLQYNVKVFPTDYFDFDTVEGLKMKNIYVPYVVFNNYFFDRFGSFDFQHIHTNLIQLLLTRSESENGKDFFVHIGKTHFEIVIFENNKLLFFNSYNYQTKEDFIYYILFVMEQLQLNPLEQFVQLTGIINQDSALYKIAYKYIKNVEITDLKPTAQAFPIEEKQLQEHYILLQS